MVAGMADRVSSDCEAEDSDSTDGVFARRSEALRGALIRFFQRYVRDSDEADDLVQEVFLRIVKRGSCDQLQSLDGYIFQTASSVLKDRSRRRRTRHSDRHVSFEPEVHSGMTAGPDSLLLSRETLLEVSRVLLELPENTRQVFVLRRLEEMPYREIALRLGISVSAVEKHMLRAVRHLIARAGMLHG
jgi:RNA polymerase sigma-70 factor (ECF subfamily)